MKPIATHEEGPAVMPMLVVSGAHELLRFLERVFEAKVASRRDHRDGTITRAEVRIGDQILMVSEADEGESARPATLRVRVEDLDGVYAAATGAGAEGLRRPGPSADGELLGVVEDRAGNRWHLVAAGGRSG
jgi:PhnB protein